MRSLLVARKKWIISSICLLILGSSIYFYNKNNETIEQTLAFTEVKPAMQTSAMSESEVAGQTEQPIQKGEASSSMTVSIIVDIKGAVKNPGVYTLPGDARVYQAIGMAGGLLPEADAKQVNGAMPLKDGMMLYIPLKGEKAPQAVTDGMVASENGSGMVTAAQGDKVNLNTATSEQLQTIPGIGPGKAAAILQYREEHGAFKTVDELTNVSGIGPKTLEKMRGKIFVQ
ncbi:helix-hairpin-helix domain-containing protein [Aneurinibacillus sp. UBA3580]|jgi:competence protein ComEA|nr:helix-hairpin-helix domain-containing protein [Aneurinibacillus sp. UBA3580]